MFIAETTRTAAAVPIENLVSGGKARCRRLIYLTAGMSVRAVVLDALRDDPAQFFLHQVDMARRVGAQQGLNDRRLHRRRHFMEVFQHQELDAGPHGFRHQ